MPDIAGEKMVAELRETLAGRRSAGPGGLVRIELGDTMRHVRDGDGPSRLTVVPSARIWRHEQTPSGRDAWRKAGPLLVPPDEAGTRWDLLTLLAEIGRG